MTLGQDDARQVAWSALMHGGDAAAALDGELRAAKLDVRGRALATELAHGALKRRRTLEWALQKALRKPFASLDAGLRAALLLGAYQLLYLDKVPVHSAVDESVKLARTSGHAGTAAVANAVLRKIAQSRPHPPEPMIGDPPETLALYASLPDWIAAHFIDRFGFADALRIGHGINLPPRRAIRLSGIPDPAAVRVIGGMPDLSPATLGRPSAYGIPECVVLENGTTPAGAAVVVQSEESQLAVHLLDPKPGEIVFDACAGRGVKTGMIAARMNGSGAIYAIDDDDRKLAQLRRLASTSPTAIVAITADARQAYPESVPLQADAVLVDAPCSGLGIIGRRADARWRKREHDPQRFAPVQRQIIARAAGRVRTGGRLLYAVCSTHPSECEDVVDEFLAANLKWRAVSLAGWAPRSAAARALGSYLQTLPGIEGSDGFFYALIEHTAR